ncbi:MAG: GNAT family N-acetyltransferase [Candidatus Lokiarchaeota archaeon]|nr:GNAT family N-acetyltransferase [Candidatus Lokiarchaeota archaeon]
MEWFKSLLTRKLAETLDDLKDESDYFQMRLPVKKITSEFDRNLRNMANHSVFHAKIRVANLDDIESFMKLHELAWKSTKMRYKPFSKELLTDLINDQHIIFLIAKVNNVDSGFAIMYFTGENKDVGIITALGVVPELQGKGLGTILVIEIWDYFKKNGAKELRCRVEKDNMNAYRFIKSLGFELVK